MDNNALQITIRNTFYRCTRLMVRKSTEYSPGDDRLENFKESGKEDNISPEETLWGMLRKHLTSLSMMCRAIPAAKFRPHSSADPHPQAVWEEKLTDAHNYLFLLEALLKERYGWPGPDVKNLTEVQQVLGQESLHPGDRVVIHIGSATDDREHIDRLDCWCGPLVMTLQEFLDIKFDL